MLLAGLSVAVAAIVVPARTGVQESLLFLEKKQTGGVEVATLPVEQSGFFAHQLHHFPRERGYAHRPSRGDEVSIDHYVRVFPFPAGVDDFLRHAVPQYEVSHRPFTRSAETKR
jgi:hypothetical protein